MNSAETFYAPFNFNHIMLIEVDLWMPNQSIILEGIK
jgi:hypothetical protein